jgi:hypothetical protein
VPAGSARFVTFSSTPEQVGEGFIGNLGRDVRRAGVPQAGSDDRDLSNRLQRRA